MEEVKMDCSHNEEYRPEKNYILPEWVMTLKKCFRKSYEK
jgi:hypothetical protein